MSRKGSILSGIQELDRMIPTADKKLPATVLRIEYLNVGQAAFCEVSVAQKVT